MRARGRLVFDSARANARIGIRSVLTGSRSLVFRSDALTVDLVVQEGGERLAVIQGQVLDEATGTPIPLASVRLGDRGEAVPTDEHGQFAVSSLDRDGPQYLWLDTPERSVLCEIPGVAETA